MFRCIRIKYFAVSLFLLISCFINAQRKPFVSICIPHGPLTVSPQDVYSIYDDTLHYTVYHPLDKLDSIFGDTSKSKRVIDTIVEKFAVDSASLNKLKQLISTIDSENGNEPFSRNHSLKMLIGGWEWFYIKIYSSNKYLNVSMGSGYIKKYFDLVDLFNSLWQSRNKNIPIIKYNKGELAKKELRYLENQTTYH